MDKELKATTATQATQATQATEKPEEPVNTGATGSANEQPLTMEMVQKMIQSETDKVRTEYSKRLKAADVEKEELIKQKMTEEEQRQYELDQLQKQLQEKEQAITQKEMTIKTVDLLKDKGLPLDLKAFVTASDESELESKIETLEKVWNSTIKQAVESKFKDSGREPHRGGMETKTELEELREKMNDKTLRLEQRIAIKNRIQRLEAETT